MITEDEDTPDLTKRLPDEILIYIFKNLPLESILICENVCRRWRKLSQDATLWRHIVIVYSGKPGQSEVSERNLEIISTHGKYIYCLKLQYAYSYSSIKAITEKCKNLTSLELVMCRVTKEFETDVLKWQNLKKLNLRNSLLMTSDDDLIVQYDYFKNLNYLELSDFGLNMNTCDRLLNCKYLSHIIIEKIRDLNVEYIRKLILSKQNILVTFHIYGGDAIDDKCLKLLSQCPLLKDLAIIRCENLTDTGLLALSDLRTIQHIQIWNNVNFTEMGMLKTLGSKMLINLESLSLSRIRNISPVIVDIISEYYKNLKFLALYQCPQIINTDYEKQLKSKFRNIDVVLY
ncbi:F-box and leucine-rich repeat protein 13-like [Choristoneura fumiferana]|uniref:F-box and leucine-rich repeat protein 13-like n=1 Tax=Choristoneura fumiferana TaxID=7141 RepID=UPI003D15C47D